MMINQRKLELSKWQRGLLKPYRYKIVYGGRGSGKSCGIADTLILNAINKKCLILCGREYQNSIKDSVHSLLAQRIEALGLIKHFSITHNEITHLRTGSRFIFKGLRNNISSIKSMAGITHLWIEEADTLSAESWKIIMPTIREEGSEIWVSMNPKNNDDILYTQFIEPETVPDDVYRVKVNYSDNPYFPQVLRTQMERDKLRDYGYYLHVWEGECLEHSEAQVFHGKWSVSEFEEDLTERYYFGLDFGFSQDPTAGIQCYIQNNALYITHEAVKKGLEIDDTANFLLENLPALKGQRIYADNARPETISYMARRTSDFAISAVEKGKGSVEDGIEYIKTFDHIHIHRRCTNTAKEFAKYSYKVDERSGRVTNKPLDEWNHGIDSLRYSLEQCMKRSQIDYATMRRSHAMF